MPNRNAAQRQEVLRVMAVVKRAAARVQATWKVDGTVHEPGQIGQESVWRPRRDDEYPENSQHAWAQVYNETDQMIATLTVLRETARTRYAALRAEAVAADRFPHEDPQTLAKIVNGEQP